MVYDLGTDRRFWTLRVSKQAMARMLIRASSQMIKIIIIYKIVPRTGHGYLGRRIIIQVSRNRELFLKWPEYKLSAWEGVARGNTHDKSSWKEASFFYIKDCQQVDMRVRKRWS